MDTTNPFQGRWKRECTEKELKRALQKQNDGYVEWKYWNQTFFRYLEDLIVVRTNLLGGDTKDVHGGWKYESDLVLRLDWLEIQRIATMLDQNKRIV
jgi:hypothetical protein